MINWRSEKYLILNGYELSLAEHLIHNLPTLYCLYSIVFLFLEPYRGLYYVISRVCLSSFSLATWPIHPLSYIIFSVPCRILSLGILSLSFILRVLVFIFLRATSTFFVKVPGFKSISHCMHYILRCITFRFKQMGVLESKISLCFTYEDIPLQLNFWNFLLLRV